MIKINWNCFSPGIKLVSNLIKSDVSEYNELLVFELLRFGASYNNIPQMQETLYKIFGQTFTEKELIFEFQDCFLEPDNKQPIIQEFTEKFNLPFENSFLFNITLIALLDERLAFMKGKPLNISKGNEIDEFSFLLMLLSVAQSVKDNRNKEDYEFITNLIKDRLEIINESMNHP